VDKLPGLHKCRKVFNHVRSVRNHGRIALKSAFLTKHVIQVIGEYRKATAGHLLINRSS